MKKFISLIVCILVSLLFFGIVNAEETEIKPEKNQLIIVNKSINKLAFYEDGELIKILSVATGAKAGATPEGEFNVIKLIKNQPYYKLKIPGGDPRNPLGPRWIGIDVPGTWGYTYGIHGNNAPWTIGTYASAGCVRMYNEEVTWLFDQVELGAKVVIIRSNDSFENIAKSKGYELIGDKATETHVKVAIGKQISVFENPTKFYEKKASIEPNKVEVKRKYKDWYYIETGNVKGWIKDDNIDELDTAFELLSYHVNKMTEKEHFVYYLSTYLMKIEVPHIEFLETV